MFPKIALISAANSIDHIAPILPKFRDYSHIEVFCYEHLNDVSRLYYACENSFDGFMFSGYLPYLMATSSGVDFRKPHSYLNITQGDFFRTMFQLAVEHPGIDYRRVMVDDPLLNLDLSEIFPPGHEFKTMSFFPLESSMQAGFNATATMAASNINVYELALEAYRNMWRANDIDIVVTRLTNIIPILEEEKITSYLLTPSRDSMVESMDRLINLVKSSYYADALLVYGVLEWDPAEPSENRQELSAALSHCNWRNSLNLYSREEEVHISTSYAYFQELSNHLTDCSLSAHLKKNTNCSFFMGWGVGYDIRQAKQNANKAVHIAHTRGKRSTFIVNQEGLVIGPMLEDIRLNYSADTSQEIVDLSNRYDISRSHVKQILALIKQRESDIFTSEELAQGLGGSLRNARRLLTKLNTTGGAEILESEETGKRGRPSLRYRVSLT